MKNIIKTPLDSIAGNPPNPMSKGSPGVYDGEPGYPKRTSNSGCPEKIRDNPPGGPGKSSTDRDTFKTY